MSTIQTYRQASLQELADESDRRGKVIVRLEARVLELEAELERMNKWLSGERFQPTWENPDGPTAA